MTTILLFTFYSFLGCYVIARLKLFAITDLPKYSIVIYFLVKVAAGCFYGYIHSKSIYYPSKIDTWKFFFESKNETQILLNNPLAFLQHLFGNGYYKVDSNFLHTTNNYFNDLKYNVMIGLMSIFNVASGSNYYINIIFYNFIGMFGVVAFYKFCNLYFAKQNKYFSVIALCIPSFIFWSSGFHKEGLLFTAIAILLYSCSKYVQYKAHYKYVIAIVVSVFTLLILRSYLLLFLVPFLSIFIFLHYFFTRRFLLFYGLGIIVFMYGFFTVGKIIPQLNVPMITVKAQQEFVALQASTALKVDSLQPSPASFINLLPSSINIAFMQPSLTNSSLTYVPSIIENFALLALLSITLFYYNSNAKGKAASMLLIIFSVFTLLFLGYTVPIAGAIVRYKSILLPFLIVAICQYISIAKLATPKT